jgi:ferric-dicitrate binding protein FerR (iron transport regulator)
MNTMNTMNRKRTIKLLPSNSHLTDEEITLLLMGEAGWGKTQQAKAHIQHCESCQERCEALAQVWQVTRTHAGKPVAAAVPPHPIRRSLPTISRRRGLVGVGVVAMTGVALFAGSSMTGLNISFDDVEKAMKEVKTVAWTEVDMKGGKGER